MKLSDLKEKEINTNCREEIGITVGMIDGLIAQIRVLRDRDMNNEEVQEVLKDLGDDEDFQWLCDEVHK